MVIVGMPLSGLSCYERDWYFCSPTFVFDQLGNVFMLGLLLTEFLFFRLCQS